MSLTPYLITTNIRNINFPAHANLKLVKFRSFRPGRISIRVERLYFKLATTRLKFDVAHPTYYKRLSDFNLNVPVVLTVWDMIHELFRVEMDPHGFEAKIKKKAILAADRIICISENTKKDLIEILNVPIDKIRVIPLASSLDASVMDSDKQVVSRPYFLFVGGREAKYKNFKNFLEAFSKVVTINKEVMLYVVGPAFKQAEISLISELGLIDSIIHAGHISDAQLANLYNGSVALVYPSLYEGFGIPPLEAMSCGTAVIAADRASIPEVVGDAGLLFNPDEKDALAERMLYLIDNPSQREALVAKGFERAALFSWKNTVDQTINVYNEVRR